jgi:hypothetical protein
LSSSKLITNPNPGTRSFPFGVCNGCGVVVEVPADWAGAAVAVLAWEVSVFVTGAVEALAVGALGVGSVLAGVDVTVVGSTAGGVSITVTGCAAVLIGFIGLTGDTGLDTLVGFVMLFMQVF